MECAICKEFNRYKSTAGTHQGVLDMCKTVVHYINQSVYPAVFPSHSSQRYHKPTSLCNTSTEKQAQIATQYER